MRKNVRECCLFYLDALDSMASGRARFLEAGGSIVVAGVYCACRSVDANTIAVKVIEDVLSWHQVSFIKGMTLTTDAYYRETPKKVRLRREEGCIVVEMEAAAYFAVSKFRNVPLGQILYGGDDVGCGQWDSRDWVSKTSVREKLFWLSAEACTLL